MKSSSKIFAFAALLLLFMALFSACKQERKVRVKDFEAKPTKTYYNSLDDVDVYDLYFSKATGKIPYIDLVTTLNKYHGDIVYAIKKGQKNYTIERVDNGATVNIDQKSKRINFSDYDLFMKRKDAVTLLDLVADHFYIARENSGFEIRGAPIYIDYGSFLIDVALDKDIALIPLQTFADVFMQSSYETFLYNGNELFCVSDDSVFKKKGDEYSDLGNKYYETKPAELDKDFADFNMRELALNFQLNYGLKDLHGIEKFSDWFDDMGLSERLSSTDSVEFDFALAEICYKYLGDLHSSFCMSSPYTKWPEDEKRNITPSPSRERLERDRDEAFKTRESFFPNGVPGVQIIGDTVYVTFDEFQCADGRDYYTDPLTEEEKKAILSDYPSSGVDTFGLIHFANEIIQPDGRIRNVVVDLSCNTGGSLDAEIFAACWLLGGANTQIKSGITGCQASTYYVADVNFDKKVDDGDTVNDCRIFCIVSDITFSCGNLLASTLEESGKATLIGSKTGGGSCAVYLTSSASGTLFKTSSMFRFSAEKNGAFKNIDDGVLPDYKLTELRSFYNRSAKDGLTAFIRKLY